MRRFTVLSPLLHHTLAYLYVASLPRLPDGQWSAPNLPNVQELFGPNERGAYSLRP